MEKTKNKTTFTVEPGSFEIVVTREFEAPPELVFKAYTDPDLFVRWIGPHGHSARIDTFEPESGGRWRYTSISADGSEYDFHGVFHEVTPQRMIQTFEFDGMPESGHVSLDTMHIEALPEGRARLRLQSVFQSVKDRDDMAQAGMERGMAEGFERLDELLAGMA